MISKGTHGDDISMSIMKAIYNYRLNIAFGFKVNCPLKKNDSVKYPMSDK